MRKTNRNQRAVILSGIFFFLCVSASLRLIFPEHTTAQVRPVYDQGALGLGQLLKRINTTASVMMIGAHPDDEDTALLAYLARGENARTAYLSLTRGDGGQNLIGPELGESLGIIRTEELLQARRLDGAEQYFTRAYDYGFSKKLDEAKQKWDEKIILCDVVRAIRIFRPMVVVSQFAGTPADGHGQHQFSGYITPLAVHAAGDIKQCKGYEPPWLVQKFYVRHRGSGEPTLRINTGKYDPLLGRSYFEIAMEARSQHKSQEQGVLELKGDQFSSLNLIETAVPHGTNEKSVFDGIDTSITGIQNFDEEVSEDLRQDQKKVYQNANDILLRVMREYEPAAPQKLLPGLAEALVSVAGLKVRLKVPGIVGAEPIPELTEPTIPIAVHQKVNYSFALSLLEQKSQEIAEAIRLSIGLRIDALADKETAAPGDSFGMTVKVFTPEADKVRVKGLSGCTQTGFRPAKNDDPKAITQGIRREIGNATFYFDSKVPKNALPTQPYWLTEPRDGDLYRVRRSENFEGITPFQRPIKECELEVEIGGQTYFIVQPVEYRYADDIRGEVRRELNVVPKLTLSFDQNLLIVPRNAKSRDREINVSVVNNSPGAVTGSLKLIPPSGWKAVASTSGFNLKNLGEKASIKFIVSIPRNVISDKFEIGAEAIANGESFTKSMQIVSYPHIQTHRFYRDATSDVRLIDLRVVPVRVGYIRGSGDEIPAAIRQMGFNITLLEEKDFSVSDLSGLDVIVIGIRASEVRPDFAANNQRLLDWVKKGGTMIVQYQRPLYTQQNLTPYPAQMGPRVADENALVKILQPDHPIFNFPNKITEKDFEGWVQERNLYNFSTMDAKYLPLLESHDPGEPENKGGLVIADVGRGKYIYCSYSLFRQLPAGVDGAYRLFANMLSLPKAKNKFAN
ncbi:MAG: PIG-L family deacetylase [Acidobacteriota bacterium]|nr:PIG-L family deacetylase [Acidobacteriota bacterium]